MRVEQGTPPFGLTTGTPITFPQCLELELKGKSCGRILDFARQLFRVEEIALRQCVQAAGLARLHTPQKIERIRPALQMQCSSRSQSSRTLVTCRQGAQRYQRALPQMLAAEFR